MRNQASANAESCSKQKSGKHPKNRKKIAISCLTALGIFCLAYYLFHVSLARFLALRLSNLLGQEVKIGRVNLDSYRGFALENVTISEEEISLSVPRVLLYTKFHPAGKISLRRIVLEKPILLLHKGKRQIAWGEKAASPITMPTVIVNQGKLIVNNKTMDVKYLRLTGFGTQHSLSSEIFANLGFSGAIGKPVRYSGAGPTAGDGDKPRMKQLVENNLSIPRSGLASSKRVPVKLVGKVSITGKTAPNIKDSRMHADVLLSELRVGKFEIRELHGDVKLQGGRLRLTEVNGRTYGGLFHIKAETDINTGEFSLAWDTSGIHLDQLARGLDLKGKDIKGQLDIELPRLAGDLKNRESWRGEGVVRIRNGQLWEIPVLYGLATLMMKPAFRDRVFRQGRADFTISGGAINTENLKLLGDDVGFTAQGKIGLDGKLDLTVTTVFTKEFMGKMPEVIEVIPRLLKILDFFIIRHHIGGTLAKPTYEVVPLPVITEVIRKILKGLFPGKSREMPVIPK